MRSQAANSSAVILGEAISHEAGVVAHGHRGLQVHSLKPAPGSTGDSTHVMESVLLGNYGSPAFCPKPNRCHIYLHSQPNAVSPRLQARKAITVRCGKRAPCKPYGGCRRRATQLFVSARNRSCGFWHTGKSWCVKKEHGAASSVGATKVTGWLRRTRDCLLVSVARVAGFTPQAISPPRGRLRRFPPATARARGR